MHSRVSTLGGKKKLFIDSIVEHVNKGSLYISEVGKMCLM